MTQDPNAPSPEAPSPPLPLPPPPTGYVVGGTALYEDDEPEPPQATPPASEAAPPRAESPASPFTPPVLRHLLELDRVDAMKTISTIPAWARVPTEMRFPRGRLVAFVRFPSAWTDKPFYGHTTPDLPGLWRECILWNPSPGDEQIAAERCVTMQTENRYMAELIKQMIRSVDGLPIDQTGRPTAQNVDLFWTQIGVKGRGLLIKHWSQMSSVTREQRVLFFTQCVGLYVAS